MDVVYKLNGGMLDNLMLTLFKWKLLQTHTNHSQKVLFVTYSTSGYIQFIITTLFKCHHILQISTLKF